MRVVITGWKGQLGRQLCRVFAGHDLMTLDLPEDDITDSSMSSRIASFAPDLVLHAAAFTNVDGCEQDPELAYRSNAVGTQYVAQGARRCDASMVYISTNEVFAGTAREPYREWDPLNPDSVYARSKAAGEQIVRDALQRFYIVRVAWLFGPGGTNFVTKIIGAAQKNGALRVAADEFGNPTYAPDLALAVRDLVMTQQHGIYHLTNAGFCSRFEFARQVMNMVGLAGIPISPILSSEWPRPTRPPRHALLANTNAAALGIRMRPWPEALADYVDWMRTEQEMAAAAAGA